MTSFDEHKNLALGTVSAGSSIIDSTTGTSLVAASNAEAAEFPAVPFFVTVWRDQTPMHPAVEIMRATAFDGARTFTMARGQQGTTPQSFITQGWKFANTITAADIEAIEDALNGEEGARASADIVLQANIAAEAASRVAGDAATLATAETYADTHDASTLATAETYTDGKVATEAAARAAGDAGTLASAESYSDAEVAAEAATRASADSTLQSHIDTEATARASGDAATLASAEAYADAGLAVKVTGPGSAVDGDIAVFSGTSGKIVADAGVSITTDQTLGANSDALLPTERAVKGYVDGKVASALHYRGVIDASGNPQLPAADLGDLYAISVAGTVSGIAVEAGDMVLCKVDGTPPNTPANWDIIQTNINGAVVGPASAIDQHFAQFNGTTGKVIEDAGISLDTDGTLGANSDSRIASQKATRTYIAAVGLGDLFNLVAQMSALKHLSLSSGVDVSRPGFPDSHFPAGTPILTVDQYGSLQVGPEQVPTLLAPPYDYITTFLVDPVTRRTWSRSFVASDQGDPPDILFRIAGPDNTYPGIRYAGSVVAAPAGILTGYSMGQLGWVGWYAPDVAGAAGGGFAPNLSARIWAVTTDDFVKNTGTGLYKLGAQLNFGVMPNGYGQSLVTRLKIDQDGRFYVNSPEWEFDQSIVFTFRAQATAGASLITSRVAGDGNYRLQILTDGTHAWSDGTAGADVSAARTAASTFKFTSGGVWVPAGVATLAKAGAVSDADFAAGLRQNGMLGVDITNKQFYFRTGAAEWTAVGALALAGAGLVPNGTTIDVNADGVTLEVAADVLRIKDLGVSTGKIAASAVTTAKLADANVTSAKIADANVTTAKIADANVTPAKMSLTTAVTHLAADVTLTLADTFYDGPSLSLAAGTWIIQGGMTFLDASAIASVWVAKLWDGTTIYDTRQTNKRPAGGEGQALYLGTVVTLAAPATVKMSAVSGTAGTVMKAQTPYMGSGLTASGLFAVRIG